MPEEDRKRQRVAAHWTLRRRQAKLHAEYEFLSRELCQKRYMKPPIDSIELTEIEQKFLRELKERKLREVVTKQCLSVIKFLMSQKFLSYPFNEPVDTVMYRDYLNYVRTPMDFGTVKGKIGQYKTPFEFEADVRLVFENARKYNAEGTEVLEMARALEMRFEEKWTKSVLPRIEELKVNEVEDQTAFKQSKADNVTMEAETRVDECCRLLLNRLQGLGDEIRYLQCLAAAQCTALTGSEQLRLGWELTTLPPEQFQKAVNLVLMRHPGLVATMRDNTIEFDMNKMDCLTLRQLQDFVKHFSKQKAKDEVNGVPAEQPPEQKRRRRSGSQPSGKDGERSERGKLWPEFAFGIGLKPYDAETEPFIPPNTEETASLPFPSVFMNSHQLRASAEPETPPSTPQTQIKLEESPEPSPRAAMPAMTPLPAFLSTPMPLAEPKAEWPESDAVPVSAGMVLPSSYAALALAPPQSIDVIQQTLSTPRETPLSSAVLSLPTVTVSSAGISAIPLVPSSQSTGLFPPFFTANIRPTISLPLVPQSSEQQPASTRPSTGQSSSTHASTPTGTPVTSPVPAAVAETPTQKTRKASQTFKKSRS